MSQSNGQDIVLIIPPAWDSDLEACSHNPTSGSFTPLTPLPASVVCGVYLCIHPLFCLPPYFGQLESCLPRATRKHVYLYSINCDFRSQWILETWLWSFLRTSGLIWALKRENCIGMWCWILVITSCRWVRRSFLASLKLPKVAFFLPWEYLQSP